MLFNKPIRFGVPNDFDINNFQISLEQIFSTKKYTNGGPLVKEFEDKICELVNAKRCISVSNATVGLQLLAKLSKSHYSVVPSFTFAATYQSLAFVGKTPMFVDVDHVTHNIDINMLMSIDVCIMPVNLWGRLCDPIKIRNKISPNAEIYYDSAHAFGKRPGIIGDAEVFSFHATKFINCAEGGAIVTNDDSLADELVSMRNFCISDGIVNSLIGTNAKLTELAAGLGLAYIRNIDNIITDNKNNYITYIDNLKNIDGLYVVEMGDNHPNYQYIVLNVKEGLRDFIYSQLLTKNVETKKYFYPGHFLLKNKLSLPNTERLWKETLCLPNGIKQEDVLKVCNMIKNIVECYNKLELK